MFSVGTSVGISNTRTLGTNKETNKKSTTDICSTFSAFASTCLSMCFQVLASESQLLFLLLPAVSGPWTAPAPSLDTDHILNPVWKEPKWLFYCFNAWLFCKFPFAIHLLMPKYQHSRLHAPAEMNCNHVHLIYISRHKGYEEKKCFCLLNATL